MFVQGQACSLNMPIISVGGTLQTFTDNCGIRSCREVPLPVEVFVVKLGRYRRKLEWSSGSSILYTLVIVYLFFVLLL